MPAFAHFKLKINGKTILIFNLLHACWFKQQEIVRLHHTDAWSSLLKYAVWAGSVVQQGLQRDEIKVSCNRHTDWQDNWWWMKWIAMLSEFFKLFDKTPLHYRDIQLHVHQSAPWVCVLYRTDDVHHYHCLITETIVFGHIFPGSCLCYDVIGQKQLRSE